jgi:PIN like domain
MKGLFPQFDVGSPVNYGDAWKRAQFVFDTNVLLNLYRYQPSARDDLLNVLERLARQIWLPHHVALEFQRNRLSVIAEQARRFTEVRGVITKTRGVLLAEMGKLQLHRRHSLIDPEPLTSGFDQLTSGFLDDLNRLQETQQRLTTSDPLKDKIEALFDGRVGPAPADQQTIDALYKQAEARFRAAIPPGYEDAGKDDDGSAEYMHGGIIYKKKFGDFLVWNQVLSHAKSKETRVLVFVTDDSKEDWWWKVELDGPKTLGPRPELVEEARSAGGIEVFLMYSPEQFLKFSRQFLDAPISDATLTEVREVSEFERATEARSVGYRNLSSLYADRFDSVPPRELFAELAHRIEIRAQGKVVARFFEGVSSLEADLRSPEPLKHVYQLDLMAAEATDVKSQLMTFGYTDDFPVFIRADVELADEMGRSTRHVIESADDLANYALAVLRSYRLGRLIDDVFRKGVVNGVSRRGHHWTGT